MGCSKKSKENDSIVSNDAGSNVVSVQGIILIDSSFNKQIVSNGIIEAKNRSDLRFNISERISNIYVRNGQRVKKGETIAVLSNSILRNQVQKSKIEFEKSKRKLEEERINYGIEDSTDNESLSSIVLNNLYTKSGYQESKNQLENSKLLFGQTILKAPFSGLIANIEFKQGDYISPNDPFCTIIGDSNVEVVFSILESELLNVKLDQKVEIIPFSNPNIKINGIINEINPSIDKNGLIRVKALVETNGERLFDGMNVKIYINRKIDGVLVIPKEAVVLRSNKEVLFSVENGMAKWNYLKIFDENSISYAVKEGLKFRDTIIVSNNLNLANGTKVNTIIKKIESDK